MAGPYYVDGDNGDDYDGADIVDAAYDDLGGVDGNYQIDKVGAFANVAAGDVIYVNDNGSGSITPGYYTVSTVPDADSCTLTASAGADAVDVVLDDHTGLSEAEAWKTIKKVVRMMAAGEIAYIQNNGATSYDEVVAWSGKHLILIGYGAVITDGTRFEMDGGSALAKALDYDQTTNGPGPHWIENVYIHHYTDDGIEYTRSAGSGYETLTAYNAKVHNCGGNGISIETVGNHAARLVFCDVRGNTGHGFYTRSSAAVVCSRICDNGGSGIINSSNSMVVAAFCEVAANAINYNAVSLKICCTADAADGTDNWVPQDESQYRNAPPPMAVACGFSNAAAFGIDIPTTLQLILIACGFFTNTSGDIDGTPAHNVDPVTAQDPLYTNAGTFDFTLGATSPWKQQDVDVGLPDDAHHSYPDIGGMQINVTGGGGVLVHPGMTGGING